MKSRIVVLVLGLLLFSSCIVKSIQPFYVKNEIKYDAALVGNWTDNKNGDWEVLSFEDEFKKENEEGVKLSAEDLKVYDSYKNGYFIKYTKKESEALFMGIPFKVNEHLFIDFAPFEYESDELNKLVGQHLLKTHSTAYVQHNEDKSITLKWLSEKAIGALFKQDRLRLKHEKIGLDEDLVLTASSEELHNFLKKFMASDFEDKWDSDDIYTLKPAHAKP
ncbi:hypothetical protein [Winogradskyella haliclonae]|uniref:Lipoprotein n=1 Tax=Winogradskyella haliclonae TaxID=2048558 RepID=A0ABQ2BXW4_9FLAO|nr:hypothetical protein [Winogradskyella haliclonae]GGI57315.1 hypothetical protein GCM10011444_16240 [Winogradskyella haliclonae]